MQKSKKTPAVLKNKKKQITSRITEICSRLKKQKKGVATYLAAEGFSEKEIAEIKRGLVDDAIKPEDTSDKGEKKEWATSLKFSENYVYNKEGDKYVMYLRAANGNVVLPGDVVRGIKENYSNWYGNEHSINQICRNYQIPRNYLVEILRLLGITHDSEPITNEQLKEKDVVEIVNDLIEKKRFKLYQEFQKTSWKETEEAANKWFRLQEGVYDPFVNFINSWEPPKYTPIKYGGPLKQDTDKNKALLVGLSDVHFGAKTNSNESYRGKGYSTEEAMQSVRKYAESIAQLTKERKYSFSSCVLASLGDILHTTGGGCTTKGTPLSHDCLKEEQFQAAFNTIVYLVDTLLTLFPKVEVKSVKGNHNDFGDWVLFKTLEAYYRTEQRISFDVFQTDHGLFRIYNTLFIASHGASAEYKAKIPGSGKARESYIANLFLSRPGELVGVIQKVLLTADQHHLEMREYAEFEHYMLSTAVRGDKYSESLGMNNIARQNCFVIDPQGIKEVVYCYGSNVS
jgi:hypothetical protein